MYIENATNRRLYCTDGTQYKRLISRTKTTDYRLSTDCFFPHVAFWLRSGGHYVHYVHANGGKKGHGQSPRQRRSFLVCDAEDGVQVGVGVLGVCLGCKRKGISTLVSLSLSLSRRRFKGMGERGKRTARRGLGLLLGMCLGPLGLGLPDQRLLVAVGLVLGVRPLARGYGQLRVGAVEEAGRQGGPSEDLWHGR